MTAIPIPMAEFAPPPPPALQRAMAKAVLVHLALLLALTWGVSWKRQANTVAFEAELWSAIPRQAAPPPTPVTPSTSDAPKVAPAPLEDNRAEIKLQKEREKKLEAEQVKQQEKERQERIQKMQALAGNGSPTATGSAQQSSGPSATYAARIRGRVIPNITFPERDTTPGNPKAIVQFKIAPDGTILTPTIRIVQSSGLPAWDKAVVNAVEKTQQIPRDVDGRFPDTSFELTFRVKE